MWFSKMWRASRKASIFLPQTCLEWGTVLVGWTSLLPNVLLLFVYFWWWWWAPSSLSVICLYLRVKTHHNSVGVSDKDRQQTVLGGRQCVRERPCDVKVTRALFARKREVKKWYGGERPIFLLRGSSGAVEVSVAERGWRMEGQLRCLHSI